MKFVKKWFRRLAAAIAGLIALILSAGFTYEQIGRARGAGSMPIRVGRPIDIGGRTLNLYCSGEGGPTVVLEAGGNGPGYEWSLLQPRMAAFTRACWYDRAGVGWSDPAPSPRTSTSIVRDLHEMLRRAGVLPPYVLVGASAGGEYVRIYTAHYPTDVAGLVLVDSAHPDQREPDFMLAPSGRMLAPARRLFCKTLPLMVRFGVVRWIAGKMRGGPDREQFSPEQRETLVKLETQPKAFETDARQACAATGDGKVVPRLGGGNPEIDSAARAAGPLGDRPLIVLTAGRFWAPPGLEKVASDYQEVRVHQLQASLARLSTRGRQVVVDAHHGIGDEAPDAVITAVREVVEEIRGRK